MNATNESNKMYIGGRIIDKTVKLKPQHEDNKIKFFQCMGQYENGENSQYSNFHAYKQSILQENGNINIVDGEHSSSRGSLSCNDIVGASPSRFKRGRKLFVDRNEIKSVLGLSPGQYHGFANDYSTGGTYKSENGNIIISDLRKVAKQKLVNNLQKPKNMLTQMPAVNPNANKFMLNHGHLNSKLVL